MVSVILRCRRFAKTPGAEESENAEDISVAVSRARGMPYDGNKESEAYEYGLEQRKNGNGENLDLLIEATDYLDRNPDSGIMEGEALLSDLGRFKKKCVRTE